MFACKFASCILKNIIFSWRKETKFSSLFSRMNLSSVALRYFNAHSTFNFDVILLYLLALTLTKHQKSKISILSEATTYFGSSHSEVSYGLLSGLMSDLHIYFTDVFEDFCRIFQTSSKKLIYLLMCNKHFINTFS